MAYSSNPACMAYCEVRTYWRYGPEQKYPGYSCGANEPCSFTNSESVAIGESISIGVNLGAGPHAGDGDAIEASFNLVGPYLFWSALTKD